MFREMSPSASGTIQVRLADDRSLTVVVGPGVPIAIEERKPEGTIIY
ncbi:hypothetical protein GCM10011600_02150 [Pseudolysinimonas yzui]|uniref:Uncharacterized protein n=1 Tax=Pseudolysinimonas yzui TaxID=2708254 RepID=A0A8J3GMS1_9MICO|nr:hypothetical protein GCM10011600_02150 [Pseudolysinimonas yzui]